MFPYVSGALKALQCGRRGRGVAAPLSTWRRHHGSPRRPTQVIVLQSLTYILYYSFINLIKILLTKLFGCHNIQFTRKLLQITYIEALDYLGHIKYIPGQNDEHADSNSNKS